MRFPLFHLEVDPMRYLFVFIMITVCGRSKAGSRELGTSVLGCSSHPDPSFFLVPRLVYLSLVIKYPVFKSSFNPL